MDNKIGYVDAMQLEVIKNNVLDERVAQIRSTPNMDIAEGAVVYYVSPEGDDANSGTSPESPWKTPSRINDVTLEEGSYVCFERGGIYRGNFFLQNGVTYTAYGEGDKPKLYASPENGAEPEKWHKSSVENVWYYEIENEDVGTLVFNDGEACAVKVLPYVNKDGVASNRTTRQPFSGIEDISEDLVFYHAHEENRLYLYSEKNPGERFDSIEFNTKGHIFSCRGKLYDVTVDNLCLKYCGSHAIGLINAYGLCVKNCEFEWIGGSIQHKSTRYGNAIEVWENCDGFVVENCSFYQIYDAAMTPQFVMPKKEDAPEGYACYMKNIRFSNNVVECANYPVEYFMHGIWEGNPSGIYGFEISDNLFFDAGEGFSYQRPDRTEAAHIKSWSAHCVLRDFVIRNNIMCQSKNMLIHVHPVEPEFDVGDCLPIFENNIIIGREGDSFGILEQSKVHERQTYDEKIVDYLGDKCKNNQLLFLVD